MLPYKEHSTRLEKRILPVYRLNYPISKGGNDMKRVIMLTVVILSAIFTSCVTSEALPDSENNYSVVIETVGLNKERLFLLANDWMVSSFRSAEAVIEYSDSESGIIIGNATGNVYVGGIGKASVRFKITIEVKDEKSRIKLENMRFSPSDSALANAISRFTRQHYEYFVSWADEIIVAPYEKHLNENKVDEW